MRDEQIIKKELRQELSKLFNSVHKEHEQELIRTAMIFAYLKSLEIVEKLG